MRFAPTHFWCETFLSIVQLVQFEPPVSSEVYLSSVFCSENFWVSLRHWYQNFTGTYQKCHEGEHHGNLAIAIQKKKKKINVSYQACCLGNILLVVSFTSKICINTMYSTFSVLLLLPFRFTEHLLIKMLLGRHQGSPIQPSLTPSWFLYLSISSPPNQIGLMHIQIDTPLWILVLLWPFWFCSGSFW